MGAEILSTLSVWWGRLRFRNL